MRTRSITKDKEVNDTIIKELIHNSPNNGNSPKRKRKRKSHITIQQHSFPRHGAETDRQRRDKQSTVIQGNFNMPLPVIEKNK